MMIETSLSENLVRLIEVTVAVLGGLAVITVGCGLVGVVLYGLGAVAAFTLRQMKAWGEYASFVYWKRGVRRHPPCSRCDG